jgi:hypothetical protein
VKTGQPFRYETDDIWITRVDCGKLSGFSGNLWKTGLTNTEKHGSLSNCSQSVILRRVEDG